MAWSRCFTFGMENAITILYICWDRIYASVCTKWRGKEESKIVCSKCSKANVQVNISSELNLIIHSFKKIIIINGLFASVEHSIFQLLIIHLMTVNWWNMRSEVSFYLLNKYLTWSDWGKKLGKTLFDIEKFRVTICTFLAGAIPYFFINCLGKNFMWGFFFSQNVPFFVEYWWSS